MAKRTGDPSESKSFRFEEGLRQLEAIVESLESGELGLEEAIKRYEEGMLLYRACEKRLGEAKRRIEKLLAAPGDGTAATEPFDHAAFGDAPDPRGAGRPAAAPPDGEELPF